MLTLTLVLFSDGKGKERELTHGSYGLFLREHDRVLRKNAFTHFHHKFSSYENTLSELISGQMKKDVFQSKARKYQSCLEASIP